jgi:hypothetical protein
VVQAMQLLFVGGFKRLCALEWGDCVQGAQS